MLRGSFMNSVMPRYLLVILDLFFWIITALHCLVSLHKVLIYVIAGLHLFLVPCLGSRVKYCWIVIQGLLTTERRCGLVIEIWLWPGMNENSLCSPSSEWVPDSKGLGKVRRREERRWARRALDTVNIQQSLPLRPAGYGTFTFYLVYISFL